MIWLFGQNRIQVPLWLLRELETRFVQQGFELSFERISFDLTGGVLAEGVEFRTSDGELVLQASALFMDVSLFSLATGFGQRFEAMGLRDAVLFEPAVLSGTGLNSPIVHASEIFLEMRSSRVDIQRLLVRDSRDSITVHGSLNGRFLPTKDPGSTGTAAMETWEDYWFAVARLRRVWMAMHSSSHPLNIEVALQSGDTFTAAAVKALWKGCSASIDAKTGLAADRLEVDLRLVIDSSGVHPLLADVSMQSLAIRGLPSGSLQAQNLRLGMNKDFTTWVTAGALTHFDVYAEAIQISIPDLRTAGLDATAHLDFVVWGEPQTVRTQRSELSNRPTVHLDLRLPLKPVLLHPRLALEEVDEMLQLKHPLRLDAVLALGENLLDSTLRGHFSLEGFCRPAVLFLNPPGVGW
ncbi:MAG: hypothetical protein LR015_00225 [Verrucomicrobia bacterium]|nr:hypothetical protein [Verrucomicrobiota bacterium]